MSHDPVERTVITSIEKLQKDDDAKKAYILFLAGPLVGKIHHLENGDTSLGRSSDVDIVIHDNRISRHHISIHTHNDQVGIEDLGSTNGTYVNGQRIQGLTVLNDGDKIQLSTNTIFKFAWQDKTENVFHEELYKMAVLDPATALYNKRYFLERFKEEFSLAKRSKTWLTVLMLDIDHFKKVNDTHGHLAGDLVLQQVANLLKDMTRQEDILARYGGEEFVIVLRGIDDNSTYQLAERIRDTVEKTTFTFDKKTIPVTISVGLGIFNADSTLEEPDDLVKLADACLYYSKEHGRNQVTRALP